MLADEGCKQAGQRTQPLDFADRERTRTRCAVQIQHDPVPANLRNEGQTLSQPILRIDLRTILRICNVRCAQAEKHGGARRRIGEQLPSTGIVAIEARALVQPPGFKSDVARLAARNADGVGDDLVVERQQREMIDSENEIEGIDQCPRKSVLADRQDGLVEDSV